MAVSIREIAVQDLGPLKSLTLRFGRLNVIYGRNERGKTYLVEFVIRSLFKHARQWKLRAEEGRGRVRVSGLPNAGLVDFSPKSETKLEDYWDQTNPGLPPDFSKLLVVKGAEVQIAKTDGGVDRTILKRFLSNREILDRVEARISKTLRESRVESRMIVGPKRGELHAKSELESQLATIQRLFEQIDRGYSRGHHRMLVQRTQDLQEQIRQMEQAKRHLAYSIDLDLQRLRRQLLRITRTDVQGVRSKLALYRQKEFEYNRKEEEQRRAEQNSRHYLWLKNAHRLYQNRLQSARSKPKPYFLIASVALLIASAVTTFLRLPYWAMASLTGAALLALFYFRQYRAALLDASSVTEAENLKDEFKKRFAEELKGLPQILELLERTEADYNTARLLKRQVADELAQLHALKMAVSDGIFTLLGERKDPKTWDEALSMVEGQTRRLENRIREKELQIAKLGVDPSDFNPMHPGVEFSQSRLAALSERLHDTSQEIKEELQKLTNLKQLVCQQTGDDISSKWETVIEHLRERHEVLLQTYNDKLAEIVGKILVKDVIAELRKDEDSKIVSSLNSQEVQMPLAQVTSRYQRVQLKGEKLLISDPFQDFYISDLSSGAQEQVLLALRIGFSTKLMRQDKIFLILDDAFQYSDWQRRPLLIDKVAALAQDGWQILYFTMDDNIRDLFNKAGQRLGTDFTSIELT